MIRSWSVDSFPAMPLPQATIRYVNQATRRADEVTVEASDSLALALVAMKRCRAIQGDGGLILWVDFATGPIVRRRYVDGRVGRRFAR